MKCRRRHCRRRRRRRGAWVHFGLSSLALLVLVYHHHLLHLCLLLLRVEALTFPSRLTCTSICLSRACLDACLWRSSEVLQLLRWLLLPGVRVGVRSETGNRGEARGQATVRMRVQLGHHRT